MCPYRDYGAGLTMLLGPLQDGSAPSWPVATSGTRGGCGGLCALTGMEARPDTNCRRRAGIVSTHLPIRLRRRYVFKPASRRVAPQHCGCVAMRSWGLRAWSPRSNGHIVYSDRCACFLDTLPGFGSQRATELGTVKVDFSVKRPSWPFEQPGTAQSHRPVLPSVSTIGEKLEACPGRARLVVTTTLRDGAASRRVEDGHGRLKPARDGLSLRK